MFETKFVEKIKTLILFSVTLYFVEKITKKKTHFVLIFFPPENHVVYKIMWRSIAEPYRPQNRCDMHDGRLRQETHNIITCNNYCSSIEIMTNQSRLCLAFYVDWLSCIVILQSTYKSPMGISFRSPSYYYGIFLTSH
jgi:hypothetical protein